MAAACVMLAAGTVAALAVGAVGAVAAAAPAGAVRTVADERRDKDAYFRDNPWSPLRAFARYDFAAGAAGDPEPSVVIGSTPDAGVRFDGPGVLPRHLRLTVLPPGKENGPWRFRIERLAAGAAIRIGGEDWPAAAPAAADPLSGDMRVVDEDTVIEAGPFALRPYVQSDTGILIEFDRRRTDGSAFVPPAWFPVDPAWVFRAPLQRYKEPEAMSILTSLGRRKEYLRVGWFEIAPPGAAAASPADTPRPAPVRVYAYRATFVAQAEESLSILFTDRTTGAESYAAGRYLDLGPPQDGLYTLDFNRAYNPLCAYTHVYNCPIPPQENALPIAVRAGERSWPGRPHH
jgi:hypothetical protein